MRNARRKKKNKMSITQLKRAASPRKSHRFYLGAEPVIIWYIVKAEDEMQPAIYFDDSDIFVYMALLNKNSINGCHAL